VQLAVLTLGFLVLMQTLASAAVPLDILHGRWLKVAIAAKGYEISAATGDVLKRKISSTAYVLFEKDSDFTYRLTVYGQEHGWGNWQLYLILPRQPVTATNGGLYFHFLQLESADPNAFLIVRDQGFVTIKLDAEGVLKKATYKSTAAASGWFDVNPNDFFGTASLKGAEVSAASLPFTP
jgi:hypothetical protein